MEALKRIPKIIDQVKDIGSKSEQEVIKQYKQNIRKFIEQVSKEVGNMISKYESQIKNLKLQNKQLKQCAKVVNRQDDNSKQFIRTGFISPIKKSPETSFRGFNSIQTAKSNMFTPFKVGHETEKMRFSEMLNKYQKQSDHDDFPEELINPQPQFLGKSRFEIRSKQKKNRGQQLVHCLQSGKKNLQVNTNRFIRIIGKQKKQEEQDNMDQNRQGSSERSSRGKDQTLNQSLGNICNSLDNSFLSKKSRGQRKKMIDQQSAQKIKKKERQEEMAKMMKERGMKSLLQRLRNNVSNSGKDSPQTIKASKLISCGQNTQKQQLSKSKVLINPVPVDIGKNRHNRSLNDASPTFSPTKKPQSILKQSSAILTRSLSGISAIDFAD